MLIYVSGKYSGDTEKERKDNIFKAGKVAAELWDRGHAVICPHANTSEFLVPTKITQYEDFIKGDLMMIARCDAMVMLPEWENSKGAVLEHNYALELGVPVYFYPDELPNLHPTEARCPQQAKAFSETIGKLYRTHLRKNADYSPANILATGELGLVTRLWDKIARLLNLSGFRLEISSSQFLAPKEPSNESINDTYEDAAVYSIIGLLLRKGVWGK